MSSTHEDLRQALFGRILSNLAGLDAGWTEPDVAWPGSNFNREGKAAFLLPTLDIQDTRQAALGSASDHIEGVLTLEFWVRQGNAAASGTAKTLNQYADKACDLFPRALALAVGSGFARFKTPQVSGIVEDAEKIAGWSVIVTAFPFYHFT